MGETNDETEHNSGPGSDGRLQFDLIDFYHALRHLASVVGRLAGCVPPIDEHREKELDWLASEANGQFERAWALWQAVIFPKLQRRMLPDTGRPPWPL